MELSFLRLTIRRHSHRRAQEAAFALPARPPAMSSNSSPGAKINQTIDQQLPPVVADKLPRVPETKDDLKADADVVVAKSFSGLRSLAAGGFGGICAVIVGHPFDLAKVRLQTAEAGVYKGAIDVVTKSIAKDGIARGLYAGVSAPLVGVTPMCMFNFVALGSRGIG